jgi:FAD/FMN-containing dehydrogenase
MGLIQDLAEIVGSGHVSDDPETLGKYSRDYSLVQPRRPSCVAYPANTEEVQRIVKYANERLIPVTPRSSGVSFYGAGIPSEGGIIVDLSRMDKILEIDARNKKVKVEPGVTWAQLQGELGKEGLMVCNPLLPHRSKSVLTSAMEREPILSCKTEYSDTLLTAEVVLPNGDMFWTGSALGKGMKGQHCPEGMIPGARLWLGAQGTLGIMTWANIKAEWLPTRDKVFFIPFEQIEDVAEPIYRIQRKLLGNECFVLNSFNLAAILAEKWPDDFNALREALPPWTVILCLSALHRFPKEKIAYEEEALMEIASELHFEPRRTVGGIPGLEATILAMLRQPWPKDVYWEFRYQGSCQDIFFHTTLNRVPDFAAVMAGVAAEYGYPTKDIGVYLQPLDRARACHCRFGFHCNPEDAKEMNLVRNLFLEASERAISMGGFFSTPYGPWADMVYSRAATYTYALKVVKNAYDPNNILNPGKLCL